MVNTTRGRRAAALALTIGLAACGKSSAPAPAPAASAPAEQAAPATPPAESSPAGAATAAFKTPEHGPVFYVYKDGGADATNHFVPSGFMGDGPAVSVDPACAVKPQSGTSCMKWTYDLVAGKKEGWAGVYWQDPENNWNGDKDNAGFNLKNAKTLKFWARGENGGETLKFGFGGCTGKFGDTAKKEMAGVKLTKDWQEFSIPLDGLDLQRVVFGFMWAVDGKQNTGQKVVFYLDDIRYEF